MKSTVLLTGETGHLTPEHKLDDIKIIQIRSSLAAVNNMKVNPNTGALVFYSSADTDASERYVRFFLENNIRKVLLLVVAYNEGQLSALKIKGVEDVFLKDIDIDEVIRRIGLLIAGE